MRHSCSSSSSLSSDDIPPIQQSLKRNIRARDLPYTVVDDQPRKRINRIIRIPDSSLNSIIRHMQGIQLSPQKLFSKKNEAGSGIRVKDELRGEVRELHQGHQRKVRTKIIDELRKKIYQTLAVGQMIGLPGDSEEKMIETQYNRQEKQDKHRLGEFLKSNDMIVSFQDYYQLQKKKPTEEQPFYNRFLVDVDCDYDYDNNQNYQQYGSAQDQYYMSGNSEEQSYRLRYQREDQQLHEKRQSGELRCSRSNKEDEEDLIWQIN